jgi:TPR repeat protein
MLEEESTGSERDHGMHWISRSAVAGHPDAQFLLGQAYDVGDGVDEDPAAAINWWKKGAEGGSQEARLTLGIRCYEGVSVPQDFIEAYYWLNLAAAGDDPEARMWRDCVLSRLTPGEIVLVQERIRVDQKTGH